MLDYLPSVVLVRADCDFISENLFYRKWKQIEPILIQNSFRNLTRVLTKFSGSSSLMRKHFKNFHCTLVLGRICFLLLKMKRMSKINVVARDRYILSVRVVCLDNKMSRIFYFRTTKHYRRLLAYLKLCLCVDLRASSIYSKEQVAFNSR